MKLTEWFPAEVKPVHKGVYHTRVYCDLNSSLQWYQMWTGKEWRASAISIFDAINSKSKSSFLDIEWRGLAEKP